MNRLFVLFCFLLLAVLAVCACSVAPVIVHTPPGYDVEPALQATRDAKIPVRIEHVDERTGPADTRGVFGKLVVWIVDVNLRGPDGRDRSGVAYTFPCRGVAHVESKATPSTFVHELGHVLLLQHSPNAAHNVMFPVSSGKTEIATEQRYFMQAGAERLKVCRDTLKRIRKARQR